MCPPKSPRRAFKNERLEFYTDNRFTPGIGLPGTVSPTPLFLRSRGIRMYCWDMAGQTNIPTKRSEARIGGRLGRPQRSSACRIRR
jgi:hypothetical protein